MNQKKADNTALILGIVTGALFLALIIARSAFAEQLWLSAVIGVLLVAALGTLIKQNQKALRSRSAAYGLNSAITIGLVLAILGLLNFLAVRYPGKLDLTKNRVNTLNDQTVKVLKNLAQPVHAVLFTKAAQKEQVRPLLDNYKSINPKFEVEYVDIDKEITRAKTAGIRKINTLQLTLGTKENKIDDVTEEKVTNALIKMLKTHSERLCAITGHGERGFAGTDQEGYGATKKALEDQSFEVKDLNLLQDTEMKDGKIPATCDAIAVIGPKTAFLGAEAKMIRDYMNNGGRGVFALDVNLKGGTELAPEMVSLLEGWNIHFENGLIVDPISQRLNLDASVALVIDFSKTSPITRDSHEQSLFPFSRPMTTLTTIPGVTASYLARTTPTAFLVTDFKQLQSGAVKPTEAKQMIVAATAEGKIPSSTASRPTRVVAFGSSAFAANYFTRFGGNLDLMVNSIAWLMENESLISIHAKEEAPGKINLSQKAGILIFWLTVILIPLGIATGGVVVWAVRRRL
ncbi:MAG: Gldg family protein [Oligoflexia bacterium]|nr:Gldg family protein [Oligoflexia bacterium]